MSDVRFVHYVSIEVNKQPEVTCLCLGATINS